MKSKLRQLLWRILGIDHQIILKKLDYILLNQDKYSQRGRGTYDNGAKVWRWTDALLVIGNYCSIAHGVQFVVDEGYHNSSEVTSYPFINNLTTDQRGKKIRNQLSQREGIQIGNDVWIGLNVIILPGTVIGNGVTIGANAVVSGQIPDYAIVGGIPAKIIKQKCSEEEKYILNKIAWWNWSEDEISHRKSDFYELTLDEFIQKYNVS